MTKPSSTIDSGVPSLHFPGGPLSCAERDKLLQTASELVPALRERATETNKLRRLPDETVSDLRRLGLLDLTRPREYGGYEVDQQTLMDVIAELARGCASTAWVTAIVNTAGFIAGSGLPAEACKELFESKKSACAIFNSRKGGVAREVEGGYIVDIGEWPWGSGSQVSDWAILRIMLMGDNGKPVDAGLALVPMSDLTILDEWHTTAMRGTASNVVCAENVFIPKNRVGRFKRLLTGDHLSEVDDIYRTPWLATVFLGLGPVGLGLARAALEVFKKKVDGKPMAFTNQRNRAEMSRTHICVGKAQQKIDAACMLIRRAAATLDYWRLEGEQAPLDDRLRVRSDLGGCAELSNDVVKMLYQEAGASCIMESDPLAIIARDINAVVMHGANNPATNTELYGAALMGQAPMCQQFGPILMA